MEQDPKIPHFSVLLDTPVGRAEIEVPTFQGADAAGRRAHLAAVAHGWGDLDEVTIVSVTPLPYADIAV